VLRTLTEQHPERLRVVLLGGQKLMEQKYETVLSFLSHAAVKEWPNPSVADVLAWQRMCSPGRGRSFPRPHWTRNVRGVC
jgi:hypothetical protein